MTLFIPGDIVRLPNGRLGRVDRAVQNQPPRPVDVVEVFCDTARAPWPVVECWHPSWLVPLCAACAEETTSTRRFDDELLCTDCWQAQLEVNPRAHQ